MSRLQRFRVKIRRDIGLKVKPEAEELDGRIFVFSYGWTQEESDSYPGEIAWMPHDSSYPRTGPGWISSGDLEPA